MLVARVARLAVVAEQDQKVLDIDLVVAVHVTLALVGRGLLLARDSGPLLVRLAGNGVRASEAVVALDTDLGAELCVAGATRLVRVGDLGGGTLLLLALATDVPVPLLVGAKQLATTLET